MIIELILIYYSFKIKIYDYIQLSSIVYESNILRVVVDNNERKLLYNNSSLIIDDKKISYKIEYDNGIVWQKNKKKYYEILLKINTKEKYDNNDIITFSLMKRKTSMMESIKNTWGGD